MKHTRFFTCALVCVFFLLVSCIALVQATLPVNYTNHSYVQLYLPGNITATDQPLTAKGIQTYGSAVVNSTDPKFGAGGLDFSAQGEINATTKTEFDYVYKLGTVGNYSTSFWMQQLAPDALYVMQDIGGGTAGGANGTTLFVNTKSIFGLGNETTETTADYVSNFTYSGAPPSLGTDWHYVVLTVNYTLSDFAKLYFDGTLVGAWNKTSTPPSTGAPSANPYKLLSSNAAGVNMQKVDDLVMWNGKTIDPTIIPSREFLTNPTAGFSHNYTSGAPFTVGFTDGTLGNTPTAYNYYFTNTTPGNNTEILFGTSANPSQVFGPGNFIITEQVTNTFGASNASAWLNVTVVSVPSATFTSVNITPVTNSTSYGWEGVAPFTMQFTSTSSGAPTSYVWNYTKLGSTTPVTFNQSAFSSPIYTFASSGNYTIQLNATNIYGSNQSIQITWVNITTPAPTSYFIANVSSGPTPLPVLFTDLSPGYPDTWNWSVDEGTGLQWFNLTNPLSHDLTYTFVPVRSSRVNLTVANISTMSDYSTSSMNITVTNQPPVASFVKNNTYGTTGTVFQFNDTSTGNNIYGWNWSFGDGNVSSSRNVTHQFPLGTYNVNLTVTNDGGSSTSIQTVYVSAFTSSYTANSTLGVVPMAVLFTETSTGLLPDSYYWEFGDGGTDTVQNPTHVYSTIGIFSVAHRITNGTSVSWVNTSNMIKTEIGNLSVTFTTSNTTSIDVPLVVLFTPTVTATNASPVSYTWNFGDGSPVSTDTAPVHTYTSYGSFIATMNATNVTGKLWSNKTSSTLTYGSAYPSNVSYDFMMNTMYPVLIRVKDADTLALINGVELTEGNANVPTVLNNGIFAGNLAFGSHIFRLQATGYGTKTTSLFIVYNSTYTLTMQSLSQTVRQQIISTPNTVTFHVKEGWGTLVPGAKVSIQGINTTAGSFDTIQSLFGIAIDETPIENTLMEGISDANGQVTFLVIPATRYNVTATKAGYTFQQQYISPSVSDYDIWATGTEPVFNTTVSNIEGVKVTISTAAINASYAYMNISYIDATGSTTGGNISIIEKNQTPFGTSIILASYTVSSSNYNVSTIIQHTQQQSGTVFVNTTVAQIGQVQRSYVWSMNSVPVEFMGLDANTKLLIALGIMLLTAMLGTATSARAVSIAVCIEGWIFYPIHMFQALQDRGIAGEAAILLALVFMTMIAVMANIEIRKKKEKY